MSQANFNQYVSYFEDIARNLIAIGHTDSEKHFFRLELDELLVSLGSKINWPCLVLEGYDVRFIDKSGDNVLKNRTGAFVVMDKLKNAQDFDAIHAIYDKCETICDDIISKMYFDKKTRRHAVVKDFDLEQVEYILLNNEVECSYGIRVSFPITNTHDIAVNPDKWLNS